MRILIAALLFFACQQARGKDTLIITTLRKKFPYRKENKNKKHERVLTPSLVSNNQIVNSLFDTAKHVRTDTIKGVVIIMYKDGVRMSIQAQKIVDVWGKTILTGSPQNKGNLYSIAVYKWVLTPTQRR